MTEYMPMPNNNNCTNENINVQNNDQDLKKENQDLLYLNEMLSNELNKLSRQIELLERKNVIHIIKFNLFSLKNIEVLVYFEKNIIFLVNVTKSFYGLAVNMATKPLGLCMMGLSSELIEFNPVREIPLRHFETDGEL